MLTNHWLHIYEKPKVAVSEGETQYARYLAQSYRHSKSAYGGDDTASCELQVDWTEAETIYSNYIGNRVAVYADNPQVPIWEGFISRIEYDNGRIKRSISLDAMVNRVIVQYSDNQGGSRNKVTSAVQNVTAQGIYGVKTGTYDIGEQNQNGSGISAAVRNRLLSTLALPINSTIGEASGNMSPVSIEMQGFYHTLQWDTDAVTDTTLYDENDVVLSQISGGASPSYAGRNSSAYAGNGDGVFFDDTDTSLINTGLTSYYQLSNERSLGETIWDKVLKIAEAGNNANRLVCGVSGTDFNTGTRRFYFDLANEVVEYTTQAYGDNSIYTLQGARLNGWEVQPNRAIRILSPVLNARSPQRYNEQWIKRIEYDGNTGLVSWYTDDDVTLQGVMQLNVATKQVNAPVPYAGGGRVSNEVGGTDNPVYENAYFEGPTATSQNLIRIGSNRGANAGVSILDLVGNGNISNEYVTRLASDSTGNSLLLHRGTGGDMTLQTNSARSIFFNTAGTLRASISGAGIFDVVGQARAQGLALDGDIGAVTNCFVLTNVTSTGPFSALNEWVKVYRPSDGAVRWLRLQG